MNTRYALYLICCLFIFTASVTAQELKSPSEFLGYAPGSRFTRHHRVIAYYRHLAEAAPDRVKLQTYGATHEHRELIMCYISAPENISGLETIRKAHLESVRGNNNNDKAIVWMSYNVHGNESVSTEASMQTAYDLLTQKQQWLENTIVIIDPCVNPDGRDRYVNWYNQFANSPNNIDPDSKEHHEPWLNGRPNHYMFDLNRDWAWLTQKESRQRIKVFNQWLPHVHVDFHEQSINAPYYFAPGAEPLHEVITDWQKEFQATIGKNHARYFDANGWFYFTKEVFDLLYPSYGDTYPMYNGSIGMTYEQGGSGRAGLGVLTVTGDTLTLKDRLDHHYTTGISTVEIASRNAEKLNEEFRKFYTKKDFKYKNYVMSGNPDHTKALTRLLDKHRITYRFARQATVKGYHYATGEQGSLKTSEGDLVIPTNQIKGTLVQVLFEPTTQLNDSLTYDITAWALPYAYGLQAVATRTETIPLLDEEQPAKDTLSVVPDPEAYAYISDWNSMKDARFLTALMNAGIRVRYSEKPFSVAGKEFKRGSLIITRGDNSAHKGFVQQLSDITEQYEKEITATSTGYVNQGRDFGSSSVKMIPEVKAGLLSGKPTSTLNVGEIWHFFEQQLQYPVTLLDTDYFNFSRLSGYDVLILPEGSYGEFLNEEKKDRLKNWVKNGGKLIVIGNALHALKDDKDFGLKEKQQDTTSLKKNTTPYTTWEREKLKDNITGAIYKVKVDRTHPLAFGYPDTYFSLKRGNNAFQLLDEGNVAYLGDRGDPISGFAGSEARKKIANTLVYGVHRHGKGNVIYMVDNPLFRGFWENGKLFFVNALFMVH